MPLDLSHIPVSTDSAEVQELKAKVRTVAEKYAKRHSLCSVVEQALTEIGIPKEKPIKVIASLTHPFEFETTISVVPSLLVGKTETEQKKIVAKQIGEVKINVLGSTVNGGFKIQAEHIADLNTPAPPAVPEGFPAPPDGWHWMYPSADSRVKHLVQEIGLDWGRAGILSEARYTRCGNYTWPGSWTEDSSRGENRPCANCRRRAEG